MVVDIHKLVKFGYNYSTTFIGKLNRLLYRSPAVILSIPNQTEKRFGLSNIGYEVPRKIGK